MIVNHLTTAIQGGGATATRRLHDALRASGVDSRLWCRRLDATVADDPSYDVACWQARPRDPATLLRQLLAPARRVWRRWRLKSALAGRPANSSAFSLPRIPLPTPIDPSVMGDGVLHLHGIANLVDYPSLFASIPEDLPVVWTLHDMFPFTGGCHYAGGCDAYLTQCRNCPQLGTPADKDLANVSFHVKRRALRRKNLHVVAPSKWMTREAKRSRLFANVRGIHGIPYALDTEAYRPYDKLQARRQWNISADDIVIAFGADWMEAPRKGLHDFVEALKRLDNRDRLQVVLFGKGSAPRPATELPRLRHVGYVTDTALQAQLYSAADVFVVPSLEDNLPLTGLEAMACGTPVVGFASGGVPDFVRPQQTGLLAEAGNPGDLARQINWLVQHPQDGRRMGHNAREVIEREFAQEIQVAKYTDLYRQLLDELRVSNKLGNRAA